MKHSLKHTLISLITALVILPLASCSFIMDVLSQMGESNGVDESAYFCDHEFDDGVSVDGEATCQKKGKIKYTCKLCGYTETRMSYLAHTPANENVYEHDETHHWHTCKWCNTVIDKEEHHYHENVIVQYTCLNDGESEFHCDCGYHYTDTHPAEHYFRVKSRIEPTCEHDGLETYYPCPACGTDKEDEVLPAIPHEYIGEVCKYCERDQLLDFVEDFENHGDSQSDSIQIESEAELISLGNYVCINEIDKKYVTINYPTTKNVKEIMEDILKQLTAANCSVHYSGATTGRDSFIGCSHKNTYTKKSGVDYQESVAPQLTNALSTSYVSASDSHSLSDVFKIDQRKHEMLVLDSDMLYYAVSHGYKPTFEAGSDVENLYKNMRRTLMGICNDSMSDVEKLFSIVSWSSEHAQYDYGAIKANDSNLYRWMDIRAWSIEGFFYDQKAICDAFSKAFAVFAGIEGIRCIQVSGSAHAWNKVYVDVDGNDNYQWYIIDPTFTNATVGEYESSTHIDFLNTDQYKSDSHYYYDNYRDCLATRSLNPYKYIHYKEVKNNTTDLYMQSQGEISDYFSYLAPAVKSFHSKGEDVIIELCLAQGLELKSSLLTTYFGMDVSKGYQYIRGTFDNYEVTAIIYYAK